MPNYRLGEAAAALGVSTDTLRRWVDTGRVAASRSTGGQRLIDGEALAELATSLAPVRAEGEPKPARSARNRLPGVITRVSRDGVMAQVEMQAGPHRIVSLLTREAADELGLAPGVLAVASIKATSVVVETRPVTGRAGAALAAMALLATACGRSDGSPRSEAITVLAAASLTESFTELGRRFEVAQPAVDVTFSFDASSTLARQVTEGAPADVLATADEATTEPLAASGAVGPPIVFAHNRLAILVARGNPKAVRSLADLARADLVVVLCSPQVPCGRFGAEAVERAGVSVRPRSLEPNVKGVVAKVTLGEADAGIVYVTDARAAAGRTSSIDIPREHNVAAAYVIAVVRAAPNPSPAEAFVAFVRSDAGRAVLAAAGFAP